MELIILALSPRLCAVFDGRRHLVALKEHVCPDIRGPEKYEAKTQTDFGCITDYIELTGLKHFPLRMRLSAGLSILHMQVHCPSPKSSPSLVACCDFTTNTLHSSRAP